MLEAVADQLMDLRVGLVVAVLGQVEMLMESQELPILVVEEVVEVQDQDQFLVEMVVLEL
jgi:hypothetical protein